MNDSPALAGIGPDAVIDTESHLCLRAWPSEAYPDAPRYEHYHWHEHGADLFVSEMDRAGVDRAFVISYDGYDFAPFMRRLGFTPSDFYGGVPYTRGWIDRYPDRLVWFTTLQDPRDPDNLRLLAEQLSDGAAGCKFFPAYLDLEFSDPAMTGVYDLLESLDRRLMVGLEDSPEPSLRLRDAASALVSRPARHTTIASARTCCRARRGNQMVGISYNLAEEGRTLLTFRREVCRMEPPALAGVNVIPTR